MPCNLCHNKVFQIEQNELPKSPPEHLTKRHSEGGSVSHNDCKGIMCFFGKWVNILLLRIQLLEFLISTTK